MYEHSGVCSYKGQLLSNEQEHTVTYTATWMNLKSVLNSSQPEGTGSTVRCQSCDILEDAKPVVKEIGQEVAYRGAEGPFGDDSTSYNWIEVGRSPL